MKCSCGGELKVYKKKVRREAYPVTCLYEDSANAEYTYDEDGEWVEEND